MVVPRPDVGGESERPPPKAHSRHTNAPYQLSLPHGESLALRIWLSKWEKYRDLGNSIDIEEIGGETEGIRVGPDMVGAGSWSMTIMTFATPAVFGACLKYIIDKWAEFRKISPSPVTLKTEKVEITAWSVDDLKRTLELVSQLDLLDDKSSAADRAARPSPPTQKP